MRAVSARRCGSASGKSDERQDCRPDGVALISSVLCQKLHAICKLTICIQQGSNPCLPATQIPDRYREASPISFMSRRLPPSLLIYGGRDHPRLQRGGDAPCGRAVVRAFVADGASTRASSRLGPAARAVRASRIVYILRSAANPERHYVGITASMKGRLKWHNTAPCGTRRHIDHGDSWSNSNLVMNERLASSSVI